MLVPTLNDGCRQSRHSFWDDDAVWEARVPRSNVGASLRIVSLIDHRVIRPMVVSDIGAWVDAERKGYQWEENGEPVYLDWDDAAEKVRVAPDKW